MENSRLPIWKERSSLSKGLTMLGVVISTSVVILGLLGLTGVWRNSINVFEPLIGVLMLIQWFQYRKYNQFIAYLSLMVAIFIFIVSIVILI